MRRIGTRSSKASLFEERARKAHAWRWRLAVPLGALAAFLVVASAGYRVLGEGYTWLDSLYMTVITVATVGFQEVKPLDDWGRLWTIGVIISGLIIGTVVLSLIVAMVVEGQVRAIFGRRQLERKIASRNGHTILCGYGLMSAMVARALQGAGRDVVVVDSDAGRTTAAQEAGLLYVLGDAQDEATLEAAGIRRAAVLVAMLPTDAENVFVTLTARQANPHIRVVARAEQPSAQGKLTAAGASRVICPQTLGAMQVSDVVLRPAVVDFVEIAHKGIELEMDQLVLTAQSRLCGKTLRELALPRRAGVQVVAVRRADGQAVYHPTPDLELASGDTLVLIGKRGAAAAVEELQPPAQE